jgi:conjugative relaxase-like TrwC/TraI family protein
VLNIGKLRRGGENYYLNSVARGVEDYYLGSGESPGYWMASGSADLGLKGEVQERELRMILRGVDPSGGEELVADRKGERVPGFDLTFRAPKSVALLHALGPKEASNEIVNAHDAAVAASMSYLERHASGARRGKGGKVSIASKGFIAAGFRHRTSRSGDPLLHTHVLAANVIQGVDGKWGAIDARHLYLQAKTAGYLYQAQLRAELTRRLGIEFQDVRKGCADVEGISRDVIEAFSTRRQEIESTMGSNGSARAAQIAALESRKSKDYAVSPDQLLPGWRVRALELGLDDEALRSVVDGSPRALDGNWYSPDLVGRLRSLDGLTRDDSSFSRRDVIQGLCDHLRQGADVADIESNADRFLASPGVVSLTTDLTTAPASFRLGDTPVAAGTREARHTTVSMLEVETGIVQGAEERLGEGVGLVPPQVLDRLLSGSDLFDEQRALVEGLTRSGHGVDVVMGKAGTGKTYALAAVRAAWEAAGYRVFGCALAAQAARELQEGSGISSTTLTRVLMDLDCEGFGPHTAVVVDEAAMVGTLDLAQLLKHAERSRTKVVLVGDDGQLPEIQAGGCFRALRDRLPAIELTEVKRQPFGWEKAALELLREGRGDVALSTYSSHDRVVVSKNDELTRDRLVGDWWSAWVAGDEAIMVAARHHDVSDLNARARERMRDSGKLGAEIDIAGRSFAVGDRVMMLRNDRRLGVLNGSRGTICALREAGDIQVVLDSGDVRSLPPDYVAEGWLTHGYALTGHKAQGMTADRAFVLADRTLYREWAYVAMSRGRTENKLYVVVGEDEHRRELGGQVEAVTEPMEELAVALGRSHAKEMALDLADADHLERELSLEL